MSVSVVSYVSVDKKDSGIGILTRESENRGRVMQGRCHIVY